MSDCKRYMDISLFSLLGCHLSLVGNILYMPIFRSDAHANLSCAKHVGRADFIKRLVVCAALAMISLMLTKGLFSSSLFSNFYDPRYTLLAAVILITMTFSFSVIFMTPHITGRLRDMDASPAWAAVWIISITFLAFLPGPGPGFALILFFGGLFVLGLARGKNN
jgi:uncharacterized membrane protein YhaH (DUF805 family)